MKKILTGPLFRIGVSLGVVGVLAYLLRGKLGEAFHILQHDVDWTLYGIAFSMFLLVQMVMAYRLHEIFRIQKIVITYPKTLYLCVVGLFFNLFLPSALGGDVAKVYYAYKYSGDKIRSATAIIVDRLMGILTIVLITLVSVILMRDLVEDPRILSAVYFVLAGVVVAIIFFMSPRLAARARSLSFLIPSARIRSKMTELYEAISSCRHHPGRLLVAKMTSFGGQICFIMAEYIVGRSLGFHLEPGIFFLVVPLVTVVSMAPSLGGLGVREAGAVYFLSRFVTAELALAHSLLIALMIYSTGLLSGLIYGITGGLKAQNTEEVDTLVS